MNEKGFTLVELLVYIGVLGIILLALSSLLYWFILTRAKIEATEKTISNGRLALNRIIKETRSARSIYTPTTNATTTVSRQLSLETKREVPSGEEVTYIDFYQCGSGLCMKKEFESPVLLTGEAVEVQSFSVEQGSGAHPNVSVGLNLSYKNPGSKKEFDVSLDFNTVITLRNY